MDTIGKINIGNKESGYTIKITGSKNENIVIRYKLQCEIPLIQSKLNSLQVKLNELVGSDNQMFTYKMNKAESNKFIADPNNYNSTNNDEKGFRFLTSNFHRKLEDEDGKINEDSIKSNLTQNFEFINTEIQDTLFNTIFEAELYGIIKPNSSITQMIFLAPVRPNTLKTQGFLVWIPEYAMVNLQEINAENFEELDVSQISKYVPGYKPEWLERLIKKNITEQSGENEETVSMESKQEYTSKGYLLTITLESVSNTVFFNFIEKIKNKREENDRATLRKRKMELFKASPILSAKRVPAGDGDDNINGYFTQVVLGTGSDRILTNFMFYNETHLSYKIVFEFIDYFHDLFGPRTKLAKKILCSNWMSLTFGSNWSSFMGFLWPLTTFSTFGTSIAGEKDPPKKQDDENKTLTSEELSLEEQTQEEQNIKKQISKFIISHKNEEEAWVISTELPLLPVTKKNCCFNKREGIAPMLESILLNTRIDTKVEVYVRERIIFHFVMKKNNQLKIISNGQGHNRAFLIKRNEINEKVSKIHSSGGVIKITSLDPSKMAVNGFVSACLPLQTVLVPNKKKFSFGNIINEGIAIPDSLTPDVNYINPDQMDGQHIVYDSGNFKLEGVAALLGIINDGDNIKSIDEGVISAKIDASVAKGKDPSLTRLTNGFNLNSKEPESRAAIPCHCMPHSIIRDPTNCVIKGVLFTIFWPENTISNVDKGNEDTEEDESDEDEDEDNRNNDKEKGDEGTKEEYKEGDKENEEVKDRKIYNDFLRIFKREEMKMKNNSVSDEEKVVEDNYFSVRVSFVYIPVPEKKTTDVEESETAETVVLSGIFQEMQSMFTQFCIFFVNQFKILDEKNRSTSNNVPEYTHDDVSRIVSSNYVEWWRTATKGFFWTFLQSVKSPGIASLFKFSLLFGYIEPGKNGLKYRQKITAQQNEHFEICQNYNFSNPNFVTKSKEGIVVMLMMCSISIYLQVFPDLGEKDSDMPISCKKMLYNIYEKGKGSKDEVYLTADQKRWENNKFGAYEFAVKNTTIFKSKGDENRKFDAAKNNIMLTVDGFLHINCMKANIQSILTAPSKLEFYIPSTTDKPEEEGKKDEKEKEADKLPIDDIFKLFKHKFPSVDHLEKITNLSRTFALLIFGFDDYEFNKHDLIEKYNNEDRLIELTNSELVINDGLIPQDIYWLHYFCITLFYLKYWNLILKLIFFTSDSGEIIDLNENSEYSEFMDSCKIFNEYFGGEECIKGENGDEMNQEKGTDGGATDTDDDDDYVGDIDDIEPIPFNNANELRVKLLYFKTLFFPNFPDLIINFEKTGHGKSGPNGSKKEYITDEKKPENRYNALSKYGIEIYELHNANIKYLERMNIVIPISFSDIHTNDIYSMEHFDYYKITDDVSLMKILDHNENVFGKLIELDNWNKTCKKLNRGFFSISDIVIDALKMDNKDNIVKGIEFDKQLLITAIKKHFDIKHGGGSKLLSDNKKILPYVTQYVNAHNPISKSLLLNQLLYLWINSEKYIIYKNVANNIINFLNDIFLEEKFYNQYNITIRNNFILLNDHLALEVEFEKESEWDSKFEQILNTFNGELNAIIGERYPEENIKFEEKPLENMVDTYVENTEHNTEKQMNISKSLNSVGYGNEFPEKQTNSQIVSGIKNTLVDTREPNTGIDMVNLAKILNSAKNRSDKKFVQESLENPQTNIGQQILQGTHYDKLPPRKVRNEQNLSEVNLKITAPAAGGRKTIKRRHKQSLRLKKKYSHPKTRKKINKKHITLKRMKRMKHLKP